MKKIFLSLMMVGLSLSLMAQDKPTPETKPEFTYCELVGTLRLSGKVVIVVDYGEKRRGSDFRIKDENGELVKFNSMVDGLNYMGEQGWEFVQAYTVTIGSSGVYHWLLKKKI